MAYENDNEGKEVVVVHEFSVHVHECLKCGLTFSVMAMFLRNEDEYGVDSWSLIPQTPKYCYMCGALMEK